MFISYLLIDVGDNPDRPRPGRLWLRNIYTVHQRLSMAFPSEEQINTDKNFLTPFNPDKFDQLRFLFRVDNSISGNQQRAVILVQSEAKPDWDYAFKNARMFLAANPEVKDYHPVFTNGDKLRYRIHVNLSKKSVEHRKMKGSLDSLNRPKSQGKRVALVWDKDQNPNDVIFEWFNEKCNNPNNPLGCKLETCNLIRLGWVQGFKKPKHDVDEDSENHLPGANKHKMQFRSALLEGILSVTDEERFLSTVKTGVGAGKAFGFGLLSLARYSSNL